MVHRGTEPIWLALGAIMLAYKYKVPTSYTGSYMCRAITGGSSWSGHAWPVAKDINAKTNPYVRTPTMRTIRWGIETDMPAAMVREIEAITANGIRALDWGGRWRTIKDAMHYQIRVTLGEIAGKVYAPRGFYDGGGSPPTNGDDEVSLKNGHTPSPSNAVVKYQRGLIGWTSDALPKFGADGDFGDETEEWVKKYQRAADLDQSGEIDGVTAPLLLSYLESAPVKPAKHKHPAAVTEGTKVTIGENP